MFEITNLRRWDGEPNAVGAASLASFDLDYCGVQFRNLSLLRNSAGEFVRFPTKYGRAGSRVALARFREKAEGELIEAAKRAYENAA